MYECWEARENGEVYVAGTLGLVAAAWPTPAPTQEEVDASQEARARLIAAAPDLLEACEAALQEFTECDNTEVEYRCECVAGMLTKLRAAIAKARKA